MYNSTPAPFGDVTRRRGLTAAFGLDPVRGHLAGPTLAPRRALAVLDDLRSHHDPAIDWPAFREALW